MPSTQSAENYFNIMFRCTSCLFSWPAHVCLHLRHPRESPKEQKKVLDPPSPPQLNKEGREKPLILLFLNCQTRSDLRDGSQ